MAIVVQLTSVTFENRDEIGRLVHEHRQNRIKKLTFHLIDIV